MSDSIGLPLNEIKNRASVAIAFVEGMLAGPRSKGVSIAPILQATGLEWIGAETEQSAPPMPPPARIPLDRYAELYTRLIREMDDEGFGLFSQPLRGGSFEFLCRSCLSAGNLGEALERMARFFRLILPDLELMLVRPPPGEAASLIIAERIPLGLGRVFAFEWLLRLLHGVSSWLVGQLVPLAHVSFPYPRPSHAGDYCLIYAPDMSFDASELRAHIPENWLSRPIRRDDQALRRFIEGGPGRLTTLYRRDREYSERVRGLLREALPRSLTVEAVADLMHLSPRTLHRRLEDEGSSFRLVRDALRRDIAIDRIEKTRLPLSRIANDLGFAETSAFYRAFVSWTGIGPLQYRKRVQG